MLSRSVHIKFSDHLMQEIDEAAKVTYASRSGFIRESVVMRLNNQRLINKPRLEDTLELLRLTKSDEQS